jgi:hypothetical protein
VLDDKLITRDDWVRMTEDCIPGNSLPVGLYHRRWEIETTFGELKTHQGLERNLRSRKPDGIYFEIAGHITLYFLTRWLMVEVAVKHKEDPLRFSFVHTLREIRDIHPAMVAAHPQRLSTVLRPRLIERIARWKVRPRPGRHYSRPGDTKAKNKGRGCIQQPSKMATRKETNKKYRKNAA